MTPEEQLQQIHAHMRVMYAYVRKSSRDGVPNDAYWHESKALLGELYAISGLDQQTIYRSAP